MPRLLSRCRLLSVIAGASLIAAAAHPIQAQPYDLPEHREQARQLPLAARMQPGRGWDPESGAPFDLEAHRACAKECRLRQYYEQGLDPRGLAPTGFGDRGPGGGVIPPTCSTTRSTSRSRPPATPFPARTR